MYVGLDFSDFSQKEQKHEKTSWIVQTNQQLIREMPRSQAHTPDTPPKVSV
jgi:hypothetical protein